MSMAKAFKDGKSAKAGYGRYFYKITVLLWTYLLALLSKL
jgi:hypothetical protein